MIGWLGLFVAHKVIQVSENIDATHAANEKVADAAREAEPLSWGALWDTAKDFFLLFSVLTACVVAGVKAIGPEGFVHSLLSASTLLPALIVGVLAGIGGIILQLRSN